MASRGKRQTKTGQSPRVPQLDPNTGLPAVRRPVRSPSELELAMAKARAKHSHRPR